MPIIQPNNTTGLYGVDTTVTINNAVTGNSLNIQGNGSISGNLAVGGQINAVGNITTSNFFVGNFVGNVTGNVSASGSNTEIQYNNNGFLGSDADFKFDSATNTLSVPSIVGNVLRSPGDGNLVIRNLAAVNNLTGNALFLDSNNVFFGNVNNFARFNSAAGTDLQFVGAGSGAAEISIVQTGGGGFRGGAGNIDLRTRAFATVGGFVANSSINMAGNVNIGGYGWQVSANSAGNLQVNGNVTTSSYFIGDGSLITNLPVTYGNANVSAYLASGIVTSNIITSGNITGGNLITPALQIGNAITTGQLEISTGGVSGAGNLRVNNIYPSGGFSEVAFRNLTSAGGPDGNVIMGNLTVYGQLSALGNVVTSKREVVGEQVLVGVDNSGPFNAKIALTASDGSANIHTVGNVIVEKAIFATGNVTGNYFLGNGSQLTGVVATVSPAGSNTQIQFNDGGITGASANLTFDKTSNVLSTTAISATGNITGGNINTAGNVSGNYILGNGSLLTGLPATYGNANVSNYLASGTNTANIITTGNIAGNVVNATSQGTIGNVSTVGSITNNINAFDASQNPNPYRLIYGNGYNGDYGANSDPLGAIRNSLLTIQTKQTSTTSDSNHGVRGYSGITYNDLNGQTHTNNARRAAGSGSVLWLGNGSVAMTGTQYLGASGAGGTVLVGNVGTVSMGNATIGHATGALNLVISGGGANIGNAVGTIGQIQIQSANANVTTAIAVGTQFAAPVGATVPPTTVIGYYMPNTTATYGLSSSNAFRGATNYYFLLNDDNAAQVQLGSLRRYHEFEAQTATSGSFAIDKNTAQVHNIAPTGNCTITGYSNMVTSASDGTNTDSQVDTLTIIVEQGSTPYTVTLPTGSTYKYAGNVSTVGATANAVTMISVTAANVRGTITYLTTVSPEFV